MAEPMVGEATRTLLLLRHAKSAWDRPGIQDHDRDLAPRGIDAARRVGREMLRRRLRPDLVLCSTATRARRTWTLAAAELEDMPAALELRGLYLAPAGRLLDIVQRQPDRARQLLLVGHDPGIHTLALRLVGSGGQRERAELEAKFATGALAVIAFALTGWREVADGEGRLSAFIRPRDLD